LRILHISKKIPYPQKDGESIASTNLAKSLHTNGIEIDLASLNTNKHYTDHQTAQENLDFYSEISIIDHELKLSPALALKHLLTDSSYNIERFKSVQFSKLLKNILSKRKYDCILLETIYVLPYLELIRRLSAAVIIIRAHNVEHHIWKNKAEQETNFAKALYLDQLSKQLQEYQNKHITLCDGVITLSSVDYDWYVKRLPESDLLLSPVGIDYQEYQNYQKKDSAFSFGFIGAMDWQPNLNGINWYLKEVWPKVASYHQDLNFHIAGRNMPADFENRVSNGVINHGEVDHNLSFMSSLDVLVVPLFIASGIRVKIIEAMAMGKIVLTTSKGLQGISARHGKEVMIANSASEFIQLHKIILEDKSIAQRISEHAREFAFHHFDQNKLTQHIIAFINRKIDEKLRLS